jgi:hypothetical protein
MRAPQWRAGVAVMRIGCGAGDARPAQLDSHQRSERISGEADVADQVIDVVGDDGDGRRQLAPAHLAGDGAQRGAVEVVHVRVGKEHCVDGGKVAKAETGSALAAEHDQARCKDGIDQQSTASELEEERRMSDEGDSGVASGDVRGKLWLAEQRLLMAFADQAVELSEFGEREGLGTRHGLCIYRCGCGRKGAVLKRMR